MRTAILTGRNLAIGLLLWATAGTILAAPITLTPFPFTVNKPIGIDFQDTTGLLIMSVNYPTGTPNNLDQVDPVFGTLTPFSPLVGLDNEVKVATVRTSTCQGGFGAGDVFTGNGNPGEIVRLNQFGVPAVGAVPPMYTWAALPGEPGLVRGSLFQDQFCVAGGDLIVVTGNEQNGNPTNDLVGNVWRVTSAKVATLVATIGHHLEGVVTVPNNPVAFGPAAGRILAGAEDFKTPLPGPPATAADYDPNGGKIYAINPNAVNDFFTISAGLPPTCAANGTPSGCNFQTASAFHPEDLDLVRRDSTFFGVAFSEGHVLTSPDFNQFCGQVLITQELPFGFGTSPGTSGLSTLSWNGTNFVVTPVTSNRDGTIFQWEHVTFTNGTDCNTHITIVKTPKNATFTIGQQLSFTITVTNAGAFDAAAVTLSDPLPTTGGLTWGLTSVTPGPASDCSIATQTLNCNFGTLAPGASQTVVVTTTNAGGAPAASCTGQRIVNLATATSTSANPSSVQDTGDYTCTPPPQLKVVKTPKAGTFTQGGQTSYTIVVSNPAAAGASSATNVTLTDQLPGNGGLVWTNVNINPAQGSCTLTGNLLNCNLGTIAAGASITVTVTSAATTPATACQSQPNPDAHATAAGGLVADDSGSLTCTPPPQLKVVKSPKSGTFAQGGQTSFTIVVTNPAAAGASSATNVTLTDQLPGNGGLVWTTATTSQGSCTNPIAGNALNCSLGTIAAGGSVTVTVTSAASTPAAACQSQPNPDAHATAAGGLVADDSGSLTCTPPPQLKVVKSPKSGTFAQGGQTSFTIVVSNPAAAGASSATNVTLTDQLPGNGGLVWTTATTSQGSCTNPIAGNALNCSLGTIAAGGSVTVTVTSAASTPAAACQSQPNPDAHATAAGGLVADDSGSLTCTPPVTNLQTVTQGGWHAPPHGNNPGTVLDAYFSAHPGYQPKIGDITNACGGKTLTFTSANAIRAFLPAGSTPGVLTATAINPTSSSAGVFAGQVLALTLNTQVLSSGSSLLSFVMPSGPAAGKTVATILSDADKALGGCGLPSYVTSISQLNDIVDAINNMFD